MAHVVPAELSLSLQKAATSEVKCLPLSVEGRGIAFAAACLVAVEDGRAYQDLCDMQRSSDTCVAPCG